MPSFMPQKTFIARRNFMIGLGAGILTTACATVKAGADDSPKSKILVIGAGIGGMAFAHHLAALTDTADITILEPTGSYHPCPLSSHVLAGIYGDEISRLNYAPTMAGEHVSILRTAAMHIDPERKIVVTSSDEQIPYDKLVLSPGIGFDTDNIDGYDAEATPHGWKNNDNLSTLKAQLHAMEDGGVFLLSAPQKPYRCSPAPYERAGLVAAYLKRHKPRSKVIVIDQKPSFPQQALFQAAWQEQFGSMLEWVTGDFVGEITAYHAGDRALETEWDTFSGDVINLIPNQNAGALAMNNGLTNDKGWCPVDLRTMESLLIPDIYVIGDAIDHGELPKAASIADTQAAVAAGAIAQEIADIPAPVPQFNSLCWSATHKGEAVRVMGDYHVEPDGTLIRDSLNLSSNMDSMQVRQENYDLSESWNRALFARLYG